MLSISDRFIAKIRPKLAYLGGTPDRPNLTVKWPKNGHRGKNSKICLTRFYGPWMGQNPTRMDFCDFQPIRLVLIYGRKRAIYAPPPIQTSSIAKIRQKQPKIPPKSQKYPVKIKYILFGMLIRTLVNHMDPFKHIIWYYYAQKRPKTVFLALTRSLVEHLYSNPALVEPLTGARRSGIYRFPLGLGNC